MKKLDRISISGFMSIESDELDLRDLNVVIGANGSGKSNLISVFSLIGAIFDQRLQHTIGEDPDRLLYNGRETTRRIELKLARDSFTYAADLEIRGNTLLISDDLILPGTSFERSSFSTESSFAAFHSDGSSDELLSEFPVLRNFGTYHFHDTSATALVKAPANVNDNRKLRFDASNLASYLYYLQEREPSAFRTIEEHIRLVAPFFDRFELLPLRANAEKIKLEWRQRGSAAYRDAHSFSDGTLRFICLATLLLQPELPELIVIDEPELGLHPFAIRILTDMLRAAAKRSQVVIATQSVTLLDNVDAEDVIVSECSVDKGGASTFHRLVTADLAQWLADFSLGELWLKNVIGGRPG